MPGSVEPVIETEMLAQVSDEHKAYMVSKIPRDILNKIIDNIPLRRLGKSEEIAKTCLFLIESPFITGSTIDINGGMYMR